MTVRDRDTMQQDRVAVGELLTYFQKTFMKIYTSTLPSKVKVLLAPLHETQAVTILVLFKVGSRYEHAGNNGTAHFVEHLLLRGQ